MKVKEKKCGKGIERRKEKKILNEEMKINFDVEKLNNLFFFPFRYSSWR